MFRPGDQIGPYTLVDKLGKGAFGVVWLAERRTQITTTQAAIKIPLDDDISIETIKNEADVWVRASGHPNVLPIIEADIYGDHIVIASEYAPDGSLDAWLKKHGKAPTVESAVEIVSGILSGLEHLHSRNIIHRDLKPANILFQGTTPRLADFGISRVLKSTSQSSNIMGTPSYMAPEAFDGKRNEQTDIWSVGVIFYQLLSGRLPFEQADITSLLGAILTRNPEPLPVTVPKPLQNVIARALAKDVNVRYKSATEMRTALRSPQETNPNYDPERSILTLHSPQHTLPSLPPNISEPHVVIGSELPSRVQQPIRYGVSQSFAYFTIGLLALIAVGAVAALVISRSSLPPNISIQQANATPTATLSNATQNAVIPNSTANKRDSEIAQYPDSMPQPLNNETVQNLISAWEGAQNRKSFVIYQACYDPSFVGVKTTKSGHSQSYNYGSWMADRRKMIADAINLNVTHSNLQIRFDGDTAIAQFDQYYRSLKYSDWGPKEIRVKMTPGGAKIVREELKASYPL